MAHLQVDGPNPTTPRGSFAAAPMLVRVASKLTRIEDPHRVGPCPLARHCPGSVAPDPGSAVNALPIRRGLVLSDPSVSTTGAQPDLCMSPLDLTVTAGPLGRPGFVVKGEIDAGNADRLRAAIFDTAYTYGCPVEVDLAGVNFMDSSGVRALADASRTLERVGSGLVLCNVPRQVQRILAITVSGRSLGVRR